MKNIINRLEAIFLDFMKFAAPKIGWTVITLMMLLSILSSIVRLLGDYLGVCTP